MFLVVNAAGKYWNGIGWSQKGKEYLTPGAAVRSLQEEGEDLDQIILHEKEIATHLWFPIDSFPPEYYNF